MLTVKVSLVDVNPKMVAAWREVFEDNPEVSIHQGSMLAQAVSAWVTPTNTRGSMDQGLDGLVRQHLGPAIQTRVQQAIATQFRGQLPVGCATCVETGCPQPRFLISTPSFASAAETVSDGLTVALAGAAALQAAEMQNRRVPGSIVTLALPGLGANTGRLPVETCADLFWTAYDLLRDSDFVDFVTMRRALEAELGSLGNDFSKSAPATTAASMAAVTPVASPAAGSAVAAK
ncbi:macro domain-containing protein, partial [bacterium]|nr:macro domain-containing protein [bacterium]